MKPEEYEAIIRIVRANWNTRASAVVEQLTEKFPHVASRTLGSIYAQELQRRMKKNPHLFSEEAVQEYWERYNDSICNGEPTGFLLRMADARGLPPALLARAILQQYLQGQQKDPEQEGSSVPKAQLTGLLRDTTQIPDRRLATELHLALISDDQYGPWAECVKHSVGTESEHQLADHLHSLGLTFISELQLRSSGYDKTPDFKLDVPIGVNGRVVNWVESKALFGDEDTHKTYLQEQLWSYWNRFGPGLVIYWYGCMDTLTDDKKAKGILVRDSFPEAVVFMDPASLPTSGPGSVH